MFTPSLGFVLLFVSNPQKSSFFYQEIFELKPIEESSTFVMLALKNGVMLGLWSKYTHPKKFPANFWLTHFSDIIGASHSSDFRMWEYGGYASEGVRQVAEFGVTKKLESELKAESNKIR